MSNGRTDKTNTTKADGDTPRRAQTSCKEKIFPRLSPRRGYASTVQRIPGQCHGRHFMRDQADRGGRTDRERRHTAEMPAHGGDRSRVRDLPRRPRRHRRSARRSAAARRCPRRLRAAAPGSRRTSASTMPPALSWAPRWRRDSCRPVTMGSGSGRHRADTARSSRPLDAGSRRKTEAAAYPLETRWRQTPPAATTRMSGRHQDYPNRIARRAGRQRRSGRLTVTSTGMRFMASASGHRRGRRRRPVRRSAARRRW